MSFGMIADKFISFISKLGYTASFTDAYKLGFFSYSPLIDINSESVDKEIYIDYFYCESLEDFFQHHLSIWNQNNRPSFIAVFDNKTHIIDSRQKPDKENPLSSKIIIESFNYGIDTPNYDIAKELQLITKEGIDNADYFNFVISHQKRKKSSEVDKDLLLNLLALKESLVTGQNEETIHLLLLRCLFVKYLEDRGVFSPDYLFHALNEKSPEKLIATFKKVRKINGDLFKTNELRAEHIDQSYLNKLSLFFGYTDFRSKQGKFFPYQFDKIPIQLISNIYESFLKQETKKDHGVYYTPSFLVNFMLSHSLIQQVESATNSTVLDPACGSGAFLVQAFKILIIANNAENNYDLKKQILQKQIFGIDLDHRALQIAAFSLYLSLLEGENSDFIRDKIKTESPILPTLIGKTLIKGNALTDEITFEIDNQKSKRQFDCIVGNPPWGSVSDDEDSETIKTRSAIGNKQQLGTMPEYNSVSDFQRSQAFLLRAKEWCKNDTIVSMVVNNSIFLNSNASDFRKTFLQQYQLNYFYELSDINKILFKKRRIGEINNHAIETGASEPCCVVIYKSKSNEVGKSVFKYINPKLNLFTESLNLIAYSSKDVAEINQADLILEDILWKIFVNGNWADYQIIKKRLIEKDERITIECRSGFQPKNNMTPTGKVENRKIIKPSDFSRYHYKKTLGNFNWAQTLRRKPDDFIFLGERIIIPIRPLESDQLRFRAVRLNSLIVHTHNILSIKIKRNDAYVQDYKPYLAIINSKYLGYHFYNLSSQWGKGDEKRSTLRNSDIEQLPFPVFEESDEKIKALSSLVEQAENSISNKDEIEDKIDDLVYDLYNLTMFERSLINEFFDINYYRKTDKVKQTDFERYSNAFCSVFSLMLSTKAKVSTRHHVSNNIGAVFAVNMNETSVSSIDLSNIASIVKKAQMEQSFFSYVLREEKVKYYDKKNQRLFIVKSNYYKDWTKRKAIDDANEEISSLLNHLAKNDR